MRLRRPWLVACLLLTAGCPNGARIVQAGANASGGSSGSAPATHVAFLVTPSAASAGITISPAVEVAAQDTVGGTDTLFSGAVTIALGNNPGGATLTGTLSIAAVRGVASFSDLRIDVSGSGYTFAASASGLLGATSSSFNVQ
jgi:hypothetical protein